MEKITEPRTSKLYSSSNIVRVIKARQIYMNRYVIVHIEETRNISTIFLSGNVMGADLLEDRDFDLRIVLQWNLEKRECDLY
jgi:hypothetical protein